MAVRHATRRYPDALALLQEWESSLKAGALLLARDALDGEPAPELKMDLVLPSGTRVGPISAQVVNRLPDGSTALRLLDLPPEVAAAAAEAEAAVARVQEWLLARKRVAPPGGADPAEIVRLKARVKELELAVASAEQARNAALRKLAERPVAAPEEAAVAAPVGRSEAGAGAVQGRGYPLPPLHAPPQASGRLGDTSLRDVLMRVAVEKGNGVLSLELPDGRRRWGFWQKGGVVGWRTEPVVEDEVLGVLLFRANQITREQLEQSVRLMEQRACRQGDALIEMGLLTFAQLVLLLQKQAEFVLQRVLAETEGTWTFHPVAEFAERFVAPPVRVAALLFRQLRQRAKEMPSDRLAEILAPNLDRYVFITPGIDRTLEEMRLTADEQGFVKIIGSVSYRLREIPAVSNLTRSATAGTLWCLDELKLLEFRAEEAETRTAGRMAKHLSDWKLVMQRGNLFERLDIHWICTTREVERAWAKFSAEFPEGGAGYPEEWKPTVVMIRKGMEEAWTKLRQPESRREYRLTVIEKTMCDQSAILLAGRGDMAFVKSQVAEAWDCYAKAVELAPRNQEFISGLARAEAQGGRPKN